MGGGIVRPPPGLLEELEKLLSVVITQSQIWVFDKGGTEVGFDLALAAEREESPPDLDLKPGAVVGIVGLRQSLRVELDRPAEGTLPVCLDRLLFAGCGLLAEACNR